MKKVLLALALCLALCLSLLGCGEKKTGADYLFDALDNLADGVQNQKLEKFSFAASDSLEMKLEVADADALIDLIGIGASGLPSFGNVSLSSKVKGESQAVELGITMNSKAYAAQFILDKDNMVLVTDMLSKSYGLSLDEVKQMAAGDLSAEALDSVGMTMDAAEAQAAMQRYFDLIEATMREKVEFVLAENGKNVLINFTLTPENAADLCAALFEEAREDEFVQKLLEMQNADVTAFFSMSAEDVRTELLDALTDAGFTANFAAEVVKKGSKLVALNGDVTMDGETVQFGLSATENGVHFIGEGGMTTVEVSVSAGKDLFGLDVAVGEDDETVTVQLSFENGVGTCRVSTAENIDITVNMTYTLADKALDLTVGSVTIASQTYDLTEAGVTVHLGSEFDMPEAPAEYTSVADFGEAEWQAVATDLLTKNPELLTMLMGMMQ